MLTFRYRKTNVSNCDLGRMVGGGWVAFFAESISNRILLNRIFQIILFKMELTTNKKQSFFSKMESSSKWSQN